jgi:hypothetical protein
MDTNKKEDFEQLHNFKFADIDHDFRCLNYHFRSAGESLIPKLSYFDILSSGVREALHCGYDKLIVIEFGVGGGGGLLELCDYVNLFQNLYNLDIQVYGFDNGTGLPPPVDYKDHPEIWHESQFLMDENLKDKLPNFCHLIIGDVKDTISSFAEQIKDYKICFVSLDLDYYSSTSAALKLFDLPSTCFLPAVPMYVDDVYGVITYNPWCGAEGAINDFNSSHELRKIHANIHYDIDRLFICQVFDHPMRTGKEKLLEPIGYVFHKNKDLQNDPNKLLTIQSFLFTKSMRKS